MIMWYEKAQTVGLMRWFDDRFYEAHVYPNNWTGSGEYKV